MVWSETSDWPKVSMRILKTAMITKGMPWTVMVWSMAAAGVPKRARARGSTMTATLVWAVASWSSKKRPATTARLRTMRYCGETPRSMVSLVIPPPMLTLSWVSSMGEEATMPGTCSLTAASSSRVIKSGVLVLSGPTMLPPLYCISIMLGPMLARRLSAYCLPVSPSVVTRMMEADPMTMPSMVRRKRTLLARKLSTARRATSLNIMVERALARVRSNELSFGGVMVAMLFRIRLLSVSQRCTVSANVLLSQYLRREVYYRPHALILTPRAPASSLRP